MVAAVISHTGARWPTSAVAACQRLQLAAEDGPDDQRRSDEEGIEGDPGTGRRDALALLQGRRHRHVQRDDLGWDVAEHVERRVDRRRLRCRGRRRPANPRRRQFRPSKREAWARRRSGRRAAAALAMVLMLMNTRSSTIGRRSCRIPAMSTGATVGQPRPQVAPIHTERARYLRSRLRSFRRDDRSAVDGCAVDRASYVCDIAGNASMSVTDACKPRVHTSSTSEYTSGWPPSTRRSRFDALLGNRRQLGHGHGNETGRSSAAARRVPPTFGGSRRSRNDADRHKTVLRNHVLPAWKKDWRLRDIERLGNPMAAHGTLGLVQDGRAESSVAGCAQESDPCPIA